MKRLLILATLGTLGLVGLSACSSSADEEPPPPGQRPDVLTPEPGMQAPENRGGGKGAPGGDAKPAGGQG